MASGNSKWLCSIAILGCCLLGSELLAQESNADYACPHCDLDGVDFSNRDLSQANFSGASLRGANFRHAILNGTIFHNADLSNAHFEGAQIGASPKGITRFTGANLRTARFGKAIFSVADFQYADLSCADLSYTDIRTLVFGAVLHFEKADRCEPKFQGAKISTEFAAQWPNLNMNEAQKPQTKAAKSGDSSTNEKTSGATKESEKIWVSPSGLNDATCGTTWTAPCKTIAYAIAKAEDGVSSLYLKYGTYPAETTLLVQKRISLYGGYFQGKPTIYQSRIIGPSNGDPVLVIEGIFGDYTFSGLILDPQPNKTQGKASVALEIAHSGTITLENILINAAQASDGRPGVNGKNGRDGGSGENGDESSRRISKGGRGYGNNDGGAGGHSKSDSAGKAGQPGTTGFSAPGAFLDRNHPPNQIYCEDGNHEPVTGIQPKPGTHGKNGHAGRAGISASSLAGDFTGLTWSSVPSGSGGHGGDGGGGGGGALGAAIDWVDAELSTISNTVEGLPGGGGGAGGTGATGGTGGWSGAPSIGILLNNVAIAFGKNVVIVGAKGSAGGAGGNGGDGGERGNGGAPAVPDRQICFKTGGPGSAGGAGGNGGSGGGGAGGNGGASLGIVISVAGPFLKGNPTVYLGSAGTPGTGGNGFTTPDYPIPGQAGKAGKPGMQAARYSASQKQ